MGMTWDDPPPRDLVSPPNGETDPRSLGYLTSAETVGECILGGPDLASP